VHIVRSWIAAVSLALALVVPTLSRAEDASTYDWTGFYAGVFAGIGAVQFTDDAGTPFASGTGPFGGAAAGYQHQLDSVVFGVDADIALTGINDSYTAGIVVDGGHVSLDALGSLRGRIGFAVGDIQIYGTGGLGYGHVTDTVLATTDNHWLVGWTAGLGAAMAVTDDVSVDLQYLHGQLGPVAFFGGPLKESTTSDSVTAGVNFHF
jgi:outer membrane immunogenic protein